jgi:hypothetical protein
MSKILKATHEGKLPLGEIELNVAVLEDGQRIITQSAVFKAFGRTKRGRAIEENRVPNRPAFIDAKNMQPFIDEGLEEVLKVIPYQDKNGRQIEGYNAVILPKLCNSYLEARHNGVLVKQQYPLARASEILLVSLSKIGIIALIDEVTGYQYDRNRDELQTILKAYISEELLKWQKRFPDSFYSEMFRLRGWDYTVTNIKKRPGVIGSWTNRLVYEQLPQGVLKELKERTPKDSKGNRKHRFHQLLSDEIGHPHLASQITAVVTLMKASPNWRTFERLFARAFGQQEIDFDEIE